MLKLARAITLDDEAIGSPNLCERFTEEDLHKIGNAVFEGYQADKWSRRKWERRTQSAMDLALQVQKEKSFPWPGCSNIAFPLITIAALQFHSRAYPTLISGTEVVKCRVMGDDPTGGKTARARRIATHMSWQVLEEDQAWEEQKDRLLINLGIVGTTFTKAYYSAEKGRKVDETVLAQDLVLDYWAKSVETCPRKTHIIPKFRNGLHSHILRGTYRDVSEEPWYALPPMPQTTHNESQRDNRKGMTPPVPDEQTPFITLEQHVNLDLDNDGYAEPYIITIEETSKCVLRIVTGFDRPEDVERTRDGKIISIRAMQYFTKYSFIPSPDGGIYDVGFGVLLGPLNESTNSLVNQIVDAGTKSITAGGFLARGAKVRGGTVRFAPFAWHRVESSGDDLRKSLVPEPVREPSAVLFQLLVLLIGYVNRIAGTTDPMVGENPGQNTTAETMRTMVEQGTKIYSAVFKRVWRSMKEEFKKDYILNAIYMPRRKSYGEGFVALREDYLGNPDEIAPAADPNLASEGMALTQAQMLKAAAMQTPGYDPEEVERRFLRAIKVDGIDKIYPGVSKTGAPKDSKLQIEELRQETRRMELQQSQMQFVIEMQEEYRVNSAQIAKIAAEIQNMKETTQGDVADRQVALLQSVMKLLDGRNSQVLGRLDIVKKQLEVQRERVKAGSDGGNVRRLASASNNGSAEAGGGAAEARVAA